VPAWRCSDPRDSFIGVAILALGAPAYWWWRRGATRVAAGLPDHVSGPSQADRRWNRLLFRGVSTRPLRLCWMALPMMRSTIGCSWLENSGRNCSRAGWNPSDLC